LTRPTRWGALTLRQRSSPDDNSLNAIAKSIPAIRTSRLAVYYYSVAPLYQRQTAAQILGSSFQSVYMPK
jgi:hypothetical protein